MSYSSHPDPQFERPQWRTLDGTWRFAYDDGARHSSPKSLDFDREIRVPYPPESELSGIGETGFHPIVWYKRNLRLEPHEHQAGSRLILHFGAVDYRARVWVNGQFVVEHEGGHTPFRADITDALEGDQLEIVNLEIVVCAQDDPHDMHLPRGKQDWQLEPHVIWYPRTTGIWQTVWLEVVPERRIESLAWTSNPARWELGLEASFEGHVEGSSLRVRLFAQGREVCDDQIVLKTKTVSRRIALPDPGIDDERKRLLWSPEHPNLIEASLELIGPDGTVLDRISSYTALRSIGRDGRRLTLNGTPYYLRMVLDQGYWPDGLMTASDERLRADVELTKRLGFNGARKHQKIESPRWLYWCDMLGLLVWEEMPSHLAYSSLAVERLTREWLEVIRRDRSHPCIVAWVPFNESWGVPDLLTDAAQQHDVRAIYHLTKALDPSRLAIGNDGWEFVGGDWLGIHDYTSSAATLHKRYGTPEATLETIDQPSGRTLRVPGVELHGEPVVLSEFGGIAFEPNVLGPNVLEPNVLGPNALEPNALGPGTASGWGYSRSSDSQDFLEKYTALLQAAHRLQGIAGFCYTQLTDTFKEKNGLLDEHRQPKADLAKLAAATRGKRRQQEAEIEGEEHPMGYSRHWFAKPKTGPHESENTSND